MNPKFVDIEQYYYFHKGYKTLSASQNYDILWNTLILEIDI